MSQVNGAPRETKSPGFFGNLAVKASCVNDQTFVSLHTKTIFFR